MKEISCRLLVIGAGPGGYVCAIRAGQLGVDTVIVEMAKPGGTCLNVGCIPSKALIHAADEFALANTMAAGKGHIGISVSDPRIDLARTVAWKDGIVGRLNGGVTGLLKRAGVKIVLGRAAFRDGKTVEVETETGQQLVRAENVVIATGSASVELPSLPFGGSVISSTEALALPKVPEKLAVVGGGYIWLELGIAFAKMGAKVTVVEAMERILPQYDAELTRPVVRRLGELGVEIMISAKAKGLASKQGALVVEKADGKEARIAADKVLVTVGRRPAVRDIDALRLRGHRAAQPLHRGIGRARPAQAHRTAEARRAAGACRDGKLPPAGATVLFWRSLRAVRQLRYLRSAAKHVRWHDSCAEGAVMHLPHRRTLRAGLYRRCVARYRERPHHPVRS